MKKKNYKGKCVKKMIVKSEDVCRTYNEIQLKYLEKLETNPLIEKVQCNVSFDTDDIELNAYTTDFVCTKTDGNLMVRECVPKITSITQKTMMLLDKSRNYWTAHGVIDWGIVINAKK